MHAGQRTGDSAATVCESVPSPACCACGTTGLTLRFAVAVAVPVDGETLVPTTARFGEAPADIWGCPACGHGQTHPMPAAAALTAAYATAADAAYEAEAEGQRRTARAVLAQVQATGGPRESLLDVGCWVGYLLDEARRAGYTRVLGIEPSAYATARARETLAIDVLQAGALDAGPEPGAWDVVVLGDVIEHLPDPSALLDRLGVWLAPGGVACLMLPDAGSRVARLAGRRWWSIIPTHVQYFTRASVRTLLRRHGFLVLGLTSQPKTFSAGYYLERLATYLPTLRPLARLRIARRLVTPDLHDRMLVLAVRDPAARRHSGPDSS